MLRVEWGMLCFCSNPRALQILPLNVLCSASPIAENGKCATPGVGLLVDHRNAWTLISRSSIFNSFNFEKF